MLGVVISLPQSAINTTFYQTRKDLEPWLSLKALVGCLALLHKDQRESAVAARIRAYTMSHPL